MDKKQIAAVLKEMAVLMEILGSNPFKIRAHENAARALEGVAADVSVLIENGELTSIKGIGKGIADKIVDLFRNGAISEHQKLKEKVPAGLLEISKINGMGPKKVRAVWKELDIDTLDQLEEAARGGKLAVMKGFGAKTEAKILQNIELLKKYQDSHLLSDAWQAGLALVESVREFSGVIRCELAGSLRRRKEVVKDIDIVASAQPQDRAEIMKKFTSLDQVEVVNGQGETKSSVVLKGGIAADLRVVDDQQFPYTLHHFTGSKEHNVAMRQHAIKLGMKVSEWGLFKGEALVECEDEAALFSALGMSYVAPELRENYGEIEAAIAGEIPELINDGDIRGIIHTHSTWSDGVNSVAEMAAACQQRGYEYLAISDHSKAAAYANGLSVERIHQQHQEIDELNQKLEGFRVLKSIECDILADGTLDYDNEILGSFDLVIASIHSKFSMTEQEATDRMIRAINNPYVNIVGHLTGRLLLSRDGYPIDQQAVLEVAGKQGVSVEINANPHRLDLDWRLCKFALEKNVMISINPDAHRISGLDDMQYGIGVARKGWVTADRVLNCKSWQEVLAFVAKRR